MSARPKVVRTVEKYSHGLGSITKYSDGSFRYRCQINGRPYERVFYEAAHARDEAERVRKLKEHGRDIAGRIPTVREFAELGWMTRYEMKGVSVKTRRQCKSLWFAHVEPHFGDTALDEIDATDLWEWLSKKADPEKWLDEGKELPKISKAAAKQLPADQPRSTPVVKQLRSFMHDMFEAARADGYVEANPVRSVKVPPSVKLPRRDGLRIPSEEERWELVNLIHRHRTASVLMMFLGLRISEAFALRVGDVSIDDDGRSGRLTVSRQLSAHKSRSSRVTVKTPAGRRELPFASRMARILKAEVYGRADYEWLFPSLEGAGPQNPDNWRRRVFTPAAISWSLKAITPEAREKLLPLLADDRMRLALDLIGCHPRVSWRHVADMRWADLDEHCRTWTLVDFLGDEHLVELSETVTTRLCAQRELVLGHDARRTRVYHAPGRHGMGLKAFRAGLLGPFAREIVENNPRTPHELRHVWATNLIDSMAGRHSREEIESTVAKFAGHSNFETTRKVYYHELKRASTGVADTAGDEE